MMEPNFANSEFLSMSSVSDDAELTQRLGLYQVFLRLYEHNRGLLDEILSLETAGIQINHPSSLPFVQGTVLDDRAFLVTNLIGHKTQALTQPQRIWTIGRDSRQSVIPIRDARMSRSHAAIEYIEGEGFYLIDMGSSNGSYVNGEYVSHHVLLQEGDRIRLGSFSFTFFECSGFRSLRQLPLEVLSKISISDAPPTAPLAPVSDSPAEPASSPEDIAEDVAKAIYEDTSTYMFMSCRNRSDTP